MYIQKAQQDAWAQCSVRRGAARRDVQGRFNAVSEFSLIVPNFSLVPVCPGKKTVLREKFGCRCLEYRFGAEYRGKNPVLFTGFFPKGTGYFPRFPGFFPRKKTGEFEGKIRCYHMCKQDATVELLVLLTHILFSR